MRAKHPVFVGWVSPLGRNPPDAADGGLRGCAANPPYVHLGSPRKSQRLAET